MTFNPSLSSALGSKLSQLRHKRGLTLDGLAELSLVSRAAISALEQGNGNPRVQTLWNLADALGVNFSTLLDDSTDTIVSDEDGIRVRLLERQTSPKMVEVFLMELPPGGARYATAHPRDVREHIVVLAGEMRAGPREAPSLLRSGQSISFAADTPHLYAGGESPSRAIVTVVYPEPSYASDPDRDLAWPGNAGEWDAVSALLARAAIEVQNGLEVNVTTFGPPVPEAKRAQRELAKVVEGLSPSPVIRRFVTCELGPSVVSLYRPAQMSHLGACPPTFSSNLARRCWGYAESALEPASASRVDEWSKLSLQPGPIIETSLLAELCTRAGRATVPYGVGSSLHEKTVRADASQRLFEARIDVDAYESYELVHPAYARQTLAVAAQLPAETEQAGPRILDIGTGPGLPLAMLLELRPDIRAVAADPSEVAFGHLSRRFSGNDNVEIIHGSVTELGEPEKPFDCAVSIGASHHLDTAAFLCAIRGQLKSGARLIVADEMIAPYNTLEQRQCRLLRHHLWYVLDTLVSLPSDADSADVRTAERLATVLPLASAFAHKGNHDAAMRLTRDVYEEVSELKRPVVPSTPLAVFSRFHLLELQALIAGLDYEVEQKTHPGRFIAMANACGLDLAHHQRIYATDGDGHLDGGTHLFVFVVR